MSMIDRRNLLGLSGAAVLAAGVTGCTTSDGPGGSEPGGSPAAGPSWQTPAFEPYTGIEPDRPALPNRTSPYYEAMPLDPPSVSTSVPGQGGEVEFHTFLNTSPKPASQNQWWQALNDATGVDIVLSGAPVGDYPSKFQTVIAGNDLPDMMAILPGQIPDLAPLLESRAADLTDYLAGDAILDYPALANIPDYVWAGCTYNGRIHTLPAHGFPLIHGWGLRKDIAEDRGAPIAPQDGDEFYAMLKALSDYSQDRFATNNVIWLVEIVAEAMGVPNDWAEEGGAFTKDIETPQYLEALEFVRRCWDEQLIHPSAFEANFSLQSQALYESGGAPLILGGMTWMSNGATARTKDPEAETVSFPLMKWDGSGPAERYVSDGAPYQAFMKDAEPERIRELLSIIDWLAAPWGTREYLLVRSGVEGVNWTRDADGTMETGLVPGVSMSPLRYMGTSPRVHYERVAPDYALLGYEHEAEAMDVPLPSAALGLESPTGQSKGAQLNRILTSARGDIITGRKEVSSWADTIEEWKAKGGEDYRNELAAAKQVQG